jgi:hypothetical protein
MKIFIVFALMSAVLTSPCFSQTAKQRTVSARTPVNLACVRVASGGSNKITWQTDYGSQAREIARTSTYTCTVRWSGKTPTNAVLDVWFVGVPGEGGAKELALDRKSVPVDLFPGSNTVISITSSPIRNDKATYAALGEKDTSGAQLRGCVVQLIMAGEVVRVYSSQSHLVKSAWSIPFASEDDGTITNKH